MRHLIAPRYARTEFTGERTYFLTDHLGSPRALTDSDGAIVQRYDYTAYGQTTASSTAFSNPYQYTGRELDQSGLYYYRARYYSPQMGRFISEDPIGLNGGLNVYAYVGGNPISFIDPLGLRNWPKTFVSIGNTINAGRLYAQGTLRIAAGLGAEGTGIGAAAGFGSVALGFWNVLSAQKAWARAQQQWNEAACEDSSNYSADDTLKTFSGLLPWGTESDDPDEPFWRDVAGSHIQNAWNEPWDFLQEIGSVGL